MIHESSCRGQRQSVGFTSNQLKNQEMWQTEPCRATCLYLLIQKRSRRIWLKWCFRSLRTFKNLHFHKALSRSDIEIYDPDLIFLKDLASICHSWLKHLNSTSNTPLILKAHTQMQDRTSFHNKLTEESSLGYFYFPKDVKFSPHWKR